MATVTIRSIDELRSMAGQEVGVSDWHEVTQAEIDRFADATGDHQWIHVDPERAKQSPLGTTVAHGLFTLSLGPKFSYELLAFEGVGFGLNYGYDRIRFPAPLPSGSRVRMRLAVKDVEEVPGGVQLRTVQTFEADGIEKPICVAEALARLFTG